MTNRGRLVVPVMVFVMLLPACEFEFRPLAAVGPRAQPERVLAPIQLPLDEAPHRNLSEWWYVTGRLTTDDQREFGFQFVIFQAVRGDGPPAYAAHFAITDVAGQTMVFDERATVGPSTGTPESVDLCVDGWSLAMKEGLFEIRADMPGYRIDLILDPVYPAVEHAGGVLDFGALGWSYYYSYPRMSVSGQMHDDRGGANVRGTAWFDHQWGDFISVSSGGWDWMSLRFDDGRDLMLTEIWDDRRQVDLAYATLSGAGEPQHLSAHSFTTIPLGVWTSPRTNTSYPAAWRVVVPMLGLDLDVMPVFPDQELDTRRSTGKIYWEGLVNVETQGQSVGHGYVELTGYASDPGTLLAPGELNLGRGCTGSNPVQ